MQAGDVCLHVGPISHGSGYLYTPTWLAGGVNVLLDHFDPEETLQVLQDERVGYLFVVPAMLSALANHPKAAAGAFEHLKVMLIHIYLSYLIMKVVLLCQQNLKNEQNFQFQML